MSSFAAALSHKLDRASVHLSRRLPGPRVDISSTTPIVSFTFDDVPDTALSNGARILERHGARGTFYIAGGLVGTVETNRRLISAEGCAELQSRGHELASHTFSHANVRTLSRPRLAADLDRNAGFLAGAGEPHAENVALPYNVISPFTIGELRRRFRSCRGGGEGINRGALDPMLVRAVEIRQPEEHAAALTRWIDDVVANPGWLVFFVHDIADAPTPYGTTPRTFDHLVRYAAERGCALLPVRAALDRLGVPGDVH